ncbi:MAG: nucleotidyltransferase domain-containing protein [Bacteroidia bacterium]|nr:nucleotidyltransferase domain-containing protein [Bacteroidia bacterium]
MASLHVLSKWKLPFLGIHLSLFPPLSLRNGNGITKRDSIFQFVFLTHPISISPDSIGFISTEFCVIKASDHTALSKSILKTLLYFDIFQYPLTASEILNHLPTNHVTLDHITEELTRMKSQSIIYALSDFFSVQNNPMLGNRRIKGNLMALKSLSLAKKQALFISKFPFVRAVMASGSLSKNYMDELSDLDFFIITKPNRLWIARMLLRFYQKVFLLNSHKYFCINYFVDEDHLEIEEKNLYTATELATLIPLYGKEYYTQLLRANEWTKIYLPNNTLRSTENVLNNRSSWLKQQTEAMINILGATRFENLSRRAFTSRWRKRYQNNYSKEDFEVAFKAKKHVSKGHPNNYQKKVLDLYHEKLGEFGSKMSIRWND